MRLLSFIYQRSNFTPTTNHLVNLSFFISNISARFRLILAVYHQTSLKMSHPSGGPCGGKSHPLMPHISCIIPNNYNAGYINPYDVSWDFNGISNLQRSPPTTIRFLAGLLSANNHVKKKKTNLNHLNLGVHLGGWHRWHPCPGSSLYSTNFMTLLTSSKEASWLCRYCRIS